jgi:ABC-type glycerol-3-phosphate transport system substrate-binding protein
MKKNRILLLLLILVPIITFSIFAAGEQEKSEDDVVTIKMIHYAGGGRDFWEATNKRFMQEFPKIKVEQEIVQPGTYHQKLGGYVATGQGPDIVLMEAGLSTIKYKDVLLDLEDLFADVLPSVVGYDIYYNDFDPNKELLAIPVALNGHMVYYNKEVFREAGLDPDNPPRTWSEMDNAIQKIREIGKEPIALGAKEYGILWLWSCLMNETMSKKQHVGIYKNEMDWRKDGLRNVIDLMADMYNRGWFNKDAAMTTVSPEAQDMFINGQAGFFVSLLGDAFNWKIWGDSMGYENFGAMKFPVIENGFPLDGVSPGPLSDIIPVWGSYAWGITNWSDNVDESVTYLKYLLRKDVQEKFVLEGGFFPNRLEDFDISMIDAPQFPTLVEWAKEAENVPALFYCTPEEWEGFMRNTQLLLSDQTNANDFANEMQRIHDESNN